MRIRRMVAAIAVALGIALVSVTGFVAPQVAVAGTGGTDGGVPYD
ncbi:hypothetical protein [Solihabitans fulvus]|nr:hypothetical protein [Solihabitans fulvus]